MRLRPFAALALLMVAGVVHAREASSEIASSQAPNETKVVKLPSGAVVRVPADSALAGEPAGEMPAPPPVTQESGRSARLLNQGLAGVGGAFLGALIGMIGDFARIGGLPPPALTLGGGALGVTAGIFLSGLILDGRGSLLGTALGTVAGSVLAVLAAVVGTYFLYMSGGAVLGYLLFAVAIAAPIAGGLVGYEWSASHAKSALAGVIVPTQGGALVAISGRI